MIIPESESEAGTLLMRLQGALPESRTPSQIRRLWSQAELVCKTAQKARWSFEFRRQAAEFKLRAERKMGQILAGLSIRGGDHKSPRSAERSRLKSWGISDKQSSQWQLEARLPEEDLDLYFRQAESKGKVPSSCGLRRLARQYVESTKLDGNTADPLARAAGGLRSLARAGKRFACIFVNVPATASSGWAKRVPIDPRLAQLLVREAAAPQAHLYLRVAFELFEEGVKVLRAWGFSRQACIVCTGILLGPNRAWQPVRDLLLVGARDESGCHDYGLSRWIAGVAVSPIDSTEAAYRFMELQSPRPHLDLFGSQPFSHLWTTIATQRP